MDNSQLDIFAYQILNAIKHKITYDAVGKLYTYYTDNEQEIVMNEVQIIGQIGTIMRDSYYMEHLFSVFVEEKVLPRLRQRSGTYVFK
jgi:hypothetical protein